MNITGVIVRAWPEHLAAVQAQLRDQPGVEIHAVTADGRLVVTVEDANDRQLADRIMNFNDMQGVLSAAMIYHHYDSDQETPQ
jgi:nitrate reductase NapD